MLTEYQTLTAETRKEFLSYSRLLSNRITFTGATNSNRRWELDNSSETLNVEGQRICWDLIRCGLSSTPANSAIVQSGMKAIEWALSPMIMGDGNWPQLRGGQQENLTHPRCVFLASACRSIYLLERSGYPLETGWLTKIKAQLIKAALWVLNSEEFKSYILLKNTMNHRCAAATVFRITGLWSKSKSLLKAADNIFLDAATNRVTVDGVLPEAYGYDWSYQSVSMEFIAFYLRTFEKPPESVVKMLDVAAKKWCSGIDDKGIVTDSGSRTKVNSYRNSESPHGPDIDQYAQRARYIAEAPLPTTTKTLLLTKAKLLAFSGPDFSHIEEKV